MFNVVTTADTHYLCCNRVFCLGHSTSMFCGVVSLRDILYWLLISQHNHLQNCADDFDCSCGWCPKYCGDLCTRVYTSPLLLVRDYSQRTTMTWLLPQFPYVQTNNLEQTSTGSAKAQTLENSLNAGLWAGYLSALTAGGASDRRWLKACQMNWLTYLCSQYMRFSMILLQLKGGSS